MKKLFRLEENHTTPGREARAGLTTFLAMAYIIFLNPVFLSSTGMDGDGVLIATCLSAAFGSCLSAFLANKPFAMASGMGLNTFFAYTLCGAYGYSWQQALALTLIAGILFFLVAASPLLEPVLESIPYNLKHAITSGIGLFLALIGLLNAGILTMTAGFPELGDLKSTSVLVSIAGLFVTILLVVRKVKGNLIFGMLFTVILSLVTGLTAMPSSVFAFPGAWGKVFCKMSFQGLVKGNGIAGLAAFAALLLSMTMVDLFDTLGFLISADSGTGLLKKENGGYRPVLIADALATASGAIFGTSTVTCYAESATGIAEGGRTGLTALTTAGCFLIAAFFSPLAGVITAAATAPALILVGMYMFLDIKNVDFSEMDQAIPAFLTVIAMPFTYSITTGIAIGFLSHVICKVCAGKRKELHVPVVILAIIFFLYFLF